MLYVLLNYNIIDSLKFKFTELSVEMYNLMLKLFS